MFIEHVDFRIGNGLANWNGVGRSDATVQIWFVNRCCNRRLAWPVSIAPAHPVADLFLPPREHLRWHFFAANNDKSKARWNIDLVQLKDPFFPIRGRQVNDRNPLLFDERKKGSYGNRAKSFWPKNNRSATPPRRKKLFGSDVKAERGKLQHPIGWLQVVI